MGPLKTLGPGQVFWSFDHDDPENTSLWSDRVRDENFKEVRYELAAGRLYASEADAERARLKLVARMRYGQDYGSGAHACGDCLMYRPDGGDTGTCLVSDTISEPWQEACNNYIDKEP